MTMDRTPGAGGRNQQFVLACALELANYPGQKLTVLSAGSDGIDGNTRSAGAVADPTTWHALLHSALTRSNHCANSMPVRCSRRWATPW